MEGTQQTTGGTPVIGTIVRTDGPGSHHILLSGPTPAYGDFVRLDTPDGQIAIVIGTTALDTLGGRYDTAFEQSPGLRSVFDLEVGEKVRLAHVLAVGRTEPHEQGRPPVAAALATTAHRMTPAEIEAFHTLAGRPRMAYHPLLAATDADAAVLDSVLATVRAAVPRAAALIDVLRREAALRAWRDA